MLSQRNYIRINPNHLRQRMLKLLYQPAPPAAQIQHPA
jgi:hypothetical protein